MAKPIPLPFDLGLVVVDGGGIVIYVIPPKAYPLMSIVFAIVAPHSPSLEYEIPRVDGAPGTHVPECRVCTVRASVIVIEPPHTISSSSLMRQTSSRADGVPFVAVALLRRCAGQDVQDEGPRDVNAGRACAIHHSACHCG